MTTFQREQVTAMRLTGASYTAVSSKLGLSENTVKSFCRRNNLSGIIGRTVGEQRNLPNDTAVSQSFCECCGIGVIQTIGRKRKRFCSDKCRLSWWNSHAKDIKHKAVNMLACTHCGENFEVYGNKSITRKYCSIDCYAAARFGRCANA